MPIRRPLAVLPLLLLAGCGALDPPPPEAWAPRRPEIAEASFSHLVHFDTDRAELAAGELAGLEAFLMGLPEGGRYRALVLGHADERASDAYNLALSERRARHVAELLRRRGLDRVELGLRALGESRPLDPGHGEPAWSRNRRVEIRVRHWTVAAPECGEWDRAPAVHGQQLVPDLGCATAANLVSMVADPADLAEGRPLGPADGVHAAEAVVRYRTDKVKQPSKDGEKP
jgi:pilus biogenesis lipoprotein CpaD